MICPECGSTMTISSSPLQASFRGCDFEVRGIDHFKCPECGEVSFDFANAERYSQAVDEQYREAAGLLSPTQIKTVRESYGLSQREFERALGVGKTTVSRWETGRVVQTKSDDNLIRGFRDHPCYATDLLERAEIRRKEPAAKVWRRCFATQLSTELNQIDDFEVTINGR